MGTSFQALRSYCVGLAERGPRRAEGPLSGWNKFGLESFIDSDSIVSERASHESNLDCADNVIVRSDENRASAYAAID